MRVKARSRALAYVGGMQDALTWPRPLLVSRWRELVMPKEHGSWSLAFEPLAFGLLVAPTMAGAGFAVAAAAGFFARRPLRIALSDASSERRAAACRVLASLGLLVGLALTAALALAGFAWLGWVAPAALAGGAFAVFDRRNGGREQAAEIAGATAFALLPAAFAALAGAAPLASVAVATIMLGRAVPTVLCLRAAIRATKTGERRIAVPLAAAAIALGAAVALARAGAAPWAAVVFATAFALRAAGLLVFPRPSARARTLGMIEGALGAAFVLVVGATWTL